MNRLPFTRKRNKLGNQKIQVDGILFDSKVEAKYYCYLKAEKEAGRIREFILQPRCELQPKFDKGGKHYMAITYTPDFLVTYADGRKEYIDVKGQATQQGELKRKMFIYRFDIPLRWVAASKKYSKTGFIDYDDLQRIRRANKKAKEGA